MRYFIKIDNGQIIDHPIQEDNFVSAFPSIDMNNLPPTFAEFFKGTPYVNQPYRNYIRTDYVWDGNSVTEVHIDVEMTPEEKLAKQNQLHQLYNDSGIVGWIFNEELCIYEPPIPYYSWNNEQLQSDGKFSWVQVNNN
jgi:hypothetical protein